MISTPRTIQWQQEARTKAGGKVFRDVRLEPTASVYHYLEYPHALAVFSEDRLRLGNPYVWGDPYETWWFNSVFGGPSPGKQASTYALCWNRTPSSEAAWRMTGFQRATPIIRIRCLLRDVLAAATALAEQRPGSFFVGKVCYEKQKGLEKRAKSALAAQSPLSPRALANLLLRKRNALRFEHEVRTLWLEEPTQNTAVFLPIDAKSVVRQVMCSPHAHPQQRERMQQEFKDRFEVVLVNAAGLA
jgi:hypothetical protein